MGIPVKKDDSLILTVWASVTNTIRLTVRIRPANPNREPYPLTVDVVGAGDRSSARGVTIVPDPGEIEAAQLSRIDSGSPILAPGICFAQGNLSGGFGNGAMNVLEIVAGYIYTGHAPTYPGAIEGPIDGRGRLQQIITVDPAANNEMPTQTVPVGSIWKIYLVGTQLVQGITQTPLPSLRFIEPTIPLTLSQVPITPTAITASSTAQLTWAIGLVQVSFTTVVGDEFHTVGLPELFLLAGDTIDTVTDGKGANTNYGRFALSIEEWIVPA